MRFISFGGILTTVTVIFQSAPIFLPAIGLLFSPFSTLPIAIAALYNISLGVTVFVTSALILVLVNVQEAIILLFTTGLLGTALGAFLYRKGLLVSIVFSSLILCLGMIALTYFVGISAFGDVTSSESVPLTILIYTSFAFIYASIWNMCLRKFINYLIRLNVLTLNISSNEIQFTHYK